LTRIKKLNERLDALEPNLVSKVIRPIIFRGRRIETARDVDEVVEQGGRTYAATAETEEDVQN
jgi:hypothetical protein